MTKAIGKKNYEFTRQEIKERNSMTRTSERRVVFVIVDCATLDVFRGATLAPRTVETGCQKRTRV